MLLLPSVVFILFMSTMGGNIDHVPLATVRDELSHGIDDCNITNKIVSPYGCVTDIRFSCKFISFLRNKSYEVVNNSFHLDFCCCFNCICTIIIIKLLLFLQYE